MCDDSHPHSYRNGCAARAAAVKWWKSVPHDETTGWCCVREDDRDEAQHHANINVQLVLVEYLDVVEVESNGCKRRCTGPGGNGLRAMVAVSRTRTHEF